MMSAKMGTPDIIKIKVFWKKDYNLKVSVHDVINTILPRELNHNVNVVM